MGKWQETDCKDLDIVFEEKAKPFLLRSRPGDWEHTTRAVEIGKKLLCSEDGDPQVVIPALYLHDIGWSAIGNVEEFIKTPAFKRERGRDSLLHMNFSADLARGILEEVGYDPVRLDKIINIIAVHDLFEEIIALNDISATLVFEADHMDRFGKGGLQRYREMTGDVPSSDEEMSFLKKGAQSWFQTSASRELVHQLILEMKEELSNIRR